MQDIYHLLNSVEILEYVYPDWLPEVEAEKILAPSILKGLRKTLLAPDGEFFVVKMKFAGGFIPRVGNQTEVKANLVEIYVLDDIQEMEIEEPYILGLGFIAGQIIG